LRRRLRRRPGWTEHVVSAGCTSSADIREWVEQARLLARDEPTQERVCLLARAELIVRLLERRDRALQLGIVEGTALH
jgi:hypothetical protein